MKQSAIIKKILKKIKPYRLLLVGAILSAVASISLTLFIPVLIGTAKS